MTCFWDGISRVIGEKFNVINGVNPTTLVKRLKWLSHKTTIDIKWNNEKISPKMAQEFKEWIENYDINNIHNGHDCSICDPFLALICHTLRVNIVHNYNGAIITYSCDSSESIFVYSDRGHFW